MNNIKITLSVCITLILYSCSSQISLEIKDNDNYWKKEAMLNLSQKFVNYIKVRPRDSLHNYEQDIYNKFLDLNRYPFGDGLKKLKDEISSKKIPFDSIICSTFQYGLSLNQEYLIPNSYSVFHKGQIIKQYFHEPQNLVLEENFELDANEALNDFNTLMIKPDGDNSSLYIITKINCDWSFEITKVIINANPFNDN